MYWLGVIWQQAITWASFDHDACRPMVLLGLKELLLPVGGFKDQEPFLLIESIKTTSIWKC